MEYLKIAITVGLIFFAGLCVGAQIERRVAQQSQMKAEQEWRADYERRKQERLVQVRQAIAEAESDSARQFFLALARWIENDFKDDPAKN